MQGRMWTRHEYDHEEDLRPRALTVVAMSNNDDRSNDGDGGRDVELPTMRPRPFISSHCSVSHIKGIPSFPVVDSILVQLVLL